MKRTSRLVLSIALFGFALFGTPQDAQAGTLGKILTKLRKTVVNIVVTPMEIPYSIARVTESNGLVYGVPFGFLNGVFVGVERLGMNTVELTLLPFTDPDRMFYKRKLGDSPLADYKESVVRVYTDM